MRALSIIAVFACLYADAAPLHRAHRIEHPTNSVEILGVMMPPRYTQDLWQRREALREEYVRAIAEIDRIADSVYAASLTKEQKDALAANSASNELSVAKENARAIRRQWEIDGITNRMQFVKREWKEKRRIEREFYPGLKWMDSDLVKETITIGESGKVRIHILYTADGKKHRFYPDEVAEELRRKYTKRTMTR